PAAKKTAAGKKLRVRQIRSGVGRRKDFRDTIRALGIKHHQGEVVVTLNPAIEGMLRKVHHLVKVTPEE
ncbi:MAG: 50S ribosomal protein L30, partial [Gemmatimonadota bacterium]|nr:50S ribosomal protein L30 [Gemmatimonadota bacterium]